MPFLPWVCFIFNSSLCFFISSVTSTLLIIPWKIPKSTWRTRSSANACLTPSIPFLASQRRPAGPYDGSPTNERRLLLSKVSSSPARLPQFLVETPGVDAWARVLQRANQQGPPWKWMRVDFLSLVDGNQNPSTKGLVLVENDKINKGWFSGHTPIRPFSGWIWDKRSVATKIIKLTLHYSSTVRHRFLKYFSDQQTHAALMNHQTSWWSLHNWLRTLPVNY